MRIRKILSLAFVLTAAQAIAQQETANYATIDQPATEADVVKTAASIVPTARQLRWQQLELTAFFHFGVNTFTGKEWGDGKEDPQIFNPAQLDAEQWIKTVKDAGFKQVIITAKHHDGFCLWPSKYTEHSVKNSPWKNGKGDVVKEVSAACRKYGVGFGVYLSPWDRNSPLYGTEAYNDYFSNQLTELLTQYGKVDEVWFDGANGEGPNGKKQRYDFERWYALIRRLQPDAVIAVMGPDVRWVGTESGKGREQEWSVLPADSNMMKKIADGSQKDIAFMPAGDKMSEDLGSREKIRNAKGLVWYPAETDVSIRPGWFYHAAEDDKVKSPQALLDIYFSSVGYNSVLLLNIPPNKEGLLSDSDINSLKGFRKLLNEIFCKNLAKGAKITSVNGSSHSKALLDKDDATAFTTRSGDTAIIEFALASAKTFNVLELQENIRLGQRVEKFVLEYMDQGVWKTLAEGSTIGYKRLLKFNTVTAKKVRLRVLSSRLNPYLATFGLYLMGKE